MPFLISDSTSAIFWFSEGFLASSPFDQLMGTETSATAYEADVMTSVLVTAVVVKSVESTTASGLRR
jgi:hypothetical protein